MLKYSSSHIVERGFTGGTKDLLASVGGVREWDSISGLGRFPGKGNGSPLQYSSLGKSPWTEEPGELQSTGSQRARHNWASEHTAQVFHRVLFLLVYFWLCWIFIAMRRLSLVAVSEVTLRCSVWASHCGGFSCRRAQASVVVVHGLSCPEACGIFLDQRSNLCPLH